MLALAGFSTVVILWVGVVAHACNPDIKEAEVGGSWVKGLLGYISEFEEGQGNIVKLHLN